jgi:hypothetical protein
MIEACFLPTSSLRNSTQYPASAIGIKHLIFGKALPVRTGSWEVPLFLVGGFAVPPRKQSGVSQVKRASSDLLLEAGFCPNLQSEKPYNSDSEMASVPKRVQKMTEPDNELLRKAYHEAGCALALYILCSDLANGDKEITSNFGGNSSVEFPAENTSLFLSYFPKFVGLSMEGERSHYWNDVAYFGRASPKNLFRWMRC